MSLYLDPTMYEVRGKNYDMASFLFIVIELSDQLTYSATQVRRKSKFKLKLFCLTVQKKVLKSKVVRNLKKQRGISPCSLAKLQFPVSSLKLRGVSPGLAKLQFPVCPVSSLKLRGISPSLAKLQFPVYSSAQGPPTLSSQSPVSSFPVFPV